MALITSTARGAVFPANAQGSTFLNRVNIALEAHRERARLRRELNQMSHRELADLGLSEADIPDVVRGTYRRG